MDASVSNVQFTERKRGYDPEEVVNYLRHIDEKVAGLRTMAQQAVERAETAEVRARQAEEQLASGGGADEVAEAASVLSMAQRTADAAVADARQKATELVAGATEDADRIRLAAEAEAQKLVGDARKDVESTRNEHLAALRGEIDEMVAVRDAVAADMERLRSRLDVERDRLRSAAAVVMTMVDNPGSLGAMIADDTPLVDVPPLPGDNEPAGISAGDNEPDDLTAIEVDDEASVVQSATPPVAADPGTVDDAPHPDDPAGTDGPDGMTPIPEPSVTSSHGGVEAGEVAAETPEVSAAGVDEAALFGGPGNLTPEPERSDVGPAGLFAEAAGEAESTLGSLDDEDDEALKAFFEQDPDGPDDSSRWGFRRR